MKIKITLLLLAVLVFISPSFAQTTPSAVITGTATTIIGPGGTVYPVSLQIQLVGCGPEVPTVPGGSVVTNFYKTLAPGPSYSATITAYGNDVITCGTQSYTLYAATWLINNQPAAPTATYRLTQNATCNISDGTCKPIGFVPPVISKGAGLICGSGQVLNGFNADYTPNCVGFTGNPLPIFQTNNVANSSQSILNLIASGGITAVASGGNVTISGSGLIARSPTVGQAIIQPINTSLAVLTSGTGVFSYNGSEVLTIATGANIANVIVKSSNVTQNVNQIAGQFQYNGSELLNRSNGIQTTPTGNQTIAQPGTSSLTINNVNTIIDNGVFNASLFPGADIGAKVNAAIAALPTNPNPKTCGAVYIPSGVYNFSTAIVKPRCVKLFGAGADSTILHWTPVTAVAILAGDTGTFEYPVGSISDLSIEGTGFGNSAVALFIGEPNTSCTINCLFGDHQSFDRIRIKNFGIGVQWGNNAWSNDFFEDLITNNGSGIFFPSSPALSNSGEGINFHGTVFQNNVVGINVSGFSDFYFFGGSCDYNTSLCALINFGHFYGMHFEQLGGRFLDVGGAVTPHVLISGSWMQYTAATGTDPDMIRVTDVAGSSGISVTDTRVMSGHAVTNFIDMNGGTTGTQSVLSVISNQFIPFGFVITNATCNFVGCNIIGNGSALYLNGTTGVTKTCTVLPTVKNGIVTSC